MLPSRIDQPIFFRIADGITVIQTAIAKIGPVDASVKDEIAMIGNALTSADIYSEPYSLDLCEFDPDYLCVFRHVPNSNTHASLHMANSVGYGERNMIERAQKALREAKLLPP